MTPPQPASRRASRTARVLGGFAVLLGLAIVVWLASPGQGRADVFLPELGIYVLSVPAGTSYVALPIDPVSSMDAKEVFGPEILNVIEIASYDPFRDTFKTFYPSRINSTIADDFLSSNVLRVQVGQPMLLTVRGTPGVRAVDAQLRDAVTLQYFGLTSLKSVSLATVLQGLASTGRFLLGTQRFEYFDRARNEFVEVTDSSASVSLPPGTVFHIIQPPGSTPPPGTVAYLDRQADIPLQGAVDSSGVAIQRSSYPTLPTTTFGFPLPLTDLASRKLPNGKLEAIARMTVPSNLKVMTDLPETVPVRLRFRGTEKPVLTKVEVLGVKQLRIGGLGRNTLVYGTESFSKALDLSFTPQGAFLGMVATDITATQDGADVLVTNVPVSLYFQNDFEQSVAAGPGTTRLASGPILDLAFNVSPAVRVFRRWSVRSAAPMPQFTTLVAPDVYDSVTSYLEYDPDKLGVKVRDTTSWAKFALAAGLETDDGKTISSAFVPRVDLAGVQLDFMPDFLPLLTLVPTASNPGPITARFHPSGLLEVPAEGTLKVKSQGKQTNWVYEPGAGFELSVKPVISSQTGREQTTASNETTFYANVSIGAVLSARWKENPADEAKINAKIDDLIVYFQPSFIYSAGELPGSMSALASQVGAALFGTDVTGNVSLTDPFGKINDRLKFERAFGAACVIKFKDAAGKFTNTFSIAGNCAPNPSPFQTTVTTQTGYAYTMVGAYENDSGHSAALSVKFSKEFEGRNRNPTVEDLITLNTTFRLPEETGWSDQLSAVALTYFHERSPTGEVVNSIDLQANDVRTFGGALPGDNYFALGDAPTNWVLDINDFHLRAEASMDAKKKVTVHRNYALSVTAGFAKTTGVVEAPDDQTDSGRAVTFSADYTVESTAANPPAVSTVTRTAETPSIGFFDGFGTPNPFTTKKGPTDSWEANVQFDFLGFVFGGFRLDSLSAQFGAQNSGSQGLFNRFKAFGLSAAFRLDADKPWAEVTGSVESSEKSTGFTVNVDDFQLAGDSESSDAAITLNNVYFHFDKQAGLTFKDSFFKTFLLGGQLTFERGLLNDSSVSIGFDWDVGARRISANGTVAGPLLCLDLAQDCPVKSAVLSGSFVLTTAPRKVESFDIAIDTTVKPGWLEGDKTANFDLRFTRPAGQRSTFGGQLKGFFPRMDFDDDVVGPGGSVQITHLGLSYDLENKVVGYAGGATLTLPQDFKELLGLLKLPDVLTFDVSGKGKQLRVQTQYNPPVRLTILENLALSIKGTEFTKASPFALGMNASVEANGKTVPATVTYDPSDNSFNTVLPPSVVLEIPFGEGSLSIKNFALKLSKSAAGGLGIRVGGDTVLRVEEKTFTGRMAMMVDKARNASLQLTGTSNAPLATFPQIAGVTLSTSLLAVQSTAPAGNGKRAVGFELKGTVTLDPAVFPGLGGKTLRCSIAYKSNGDLAISAEENFGSVTLGIPGTPLELPIEVAVRKIGIVKKAGQSGATLTGQCKLSFLRPLNSIFGVTGDRKFTMDAEVGSETVNGKQGLFFAAKFDPSIQAAFRLLGAEGELIVPAVKVTQGGQLTLAGDLVLRRPKSTTLSFSSGVGAGGKVRFNVTANPPLTIDVGILHVDFHQLGYDQAFPGYMGVFADFGFTAGTPFFGLAGNVDDLLYILPNSIPPFGFPFFERVDATVALLGFLGKASAVLAAPKFELKDALELTRAIFAALGRDDYGPMRAFFARILTGPNAIFRGPGIGDIALGLPVLLEKALPSLPKRTYTFGSGSFAQTKDVLQLDIWTGIHYATDLFPGRTAADALVEIIKRAIQVIQFVEDAARLFGIIPDDLRQREIAFKLGGLVTASAGYALKEPEKNIVFADSPALPFFGDLGELRDFLDDPLANLPSIDDVARAAASGEEPRPLKARALSFTPKSGRAISASVTDSFLSYRTLIDAFLALVDALEPPSVSLDPREMLASHLKSIVREHGNRAGVVAGRLVSIDGKVKLDLFGNSPEIAVRLPGVADPVFSGSVPLGRRSDVPLENGTLRLDSVLGFKDGKLISDVKGVFTRKTGSVLNLGTLKSAVLEDVSSASFTRAADAGDVAGWRVEQPVDARGLARATFTDFGTYRFSGPFEFTGIQKGGSLAELRDLLRTIEPFNSAVFDQESSPYILGLKVWALLRNDPALARQVEGLSASGRTIAFRLRNAATGVAYSVNLVLEDLAFYLDPASSASGPSDVISLEGTEQLSRFRIEGNRIMAQPFSVSDGDDTTSVPDLVIFDGSPQVMQVIQLARQQQLNLLQSDLGQLSRLGLTVAGDPMIVRSLRIEVESATLRATLRPHSISLARLGSSAPLARIDDVSSFDNWQRNGPYGDPAVHVAAPGTFAHRQQTFGNINELHRKLGTDKVVRTVSISSPSQLAGDFAITGPGQFAGSCAAAGQRLNVSPIVDGFEAYIDSNQGAVRVFRGRDGQIEGEMTGNRAEIKPSYSSSQALNSGFEFQSAPAKAGGLFMSALLDLNLLLVKAKFAASGQIPSDGNFLFEGSANISIISFDVFNASCRATPADGLTFSGVWKFFFFSLPIDGKILPDGTTSGTGHLSFIFNLFSLGDTGLRGSFSIVTKPGAPRKLIVEGDLYIFAYRLAHVRLETNSQFDIGPDGVRYGQTFGDESKGASYRMLFSPMIRYTDKGIPYPSVEISGSVEAHLSLGELGVARVGASLKVDKDLNIKICVSCCGGNLTASIGLKSFSFGVSVGLGGCK